MNEANRYWVVLEDEADSEIVSIRQEYANVSLESAKRFDRAITTCFGLLEIFPEAAPIVDEHLGMAVRRVLLRGLPKALLYVVIDASLEVRVLSCYDTRSDRSNRLGG